VEFEWDPIKAAQNLRKHKVTFSDAATVFGDFLGATAADPITPSMSIAILQGADQLEVKC